MERSEVLTGESRIRVRIRSSLEFFSIFVLIWGGILKLHPRQKTRQNLSQLFAKNRRVCIA